MTKKSLAVEVEKLEKQAGLNGLLAVRRALNILIADLIESKESKFKKSDVQKYFIFVMETGTVDQSEMMSNLLQLYYEKFLAQLDNRLLNADVKKKLVISLMDQLTKFDRYKQLDNSAAPSSLNKFSKFAADKKRLLTERLTNDKFERIS